MNNVTCQKILLAGENSARSKICVRLSERFDEPQSIEPDDDENAECNSSKKQKLN